MITLSTADGVRTHYNTLTTSLKHMRALTSDHVTATLETDTDSTTFERRGNRWYKINTLSKIKPVTQSTAPTTAIIIGRKPTLTERLKETATNRLRQAGQIIKNAKTAVQQLDQKHQITTRVKSGITTAKTAIMDLLTKIGRISKRLINDNVVTILCFCVLVTILSGLDWLGSWIDIATGQPVFPSLA
jgi:hypothetical protein